MKKVWLLILCLSLYAWSGYTAPSLNDLPETESIIYFIEGIEEVAALTKGERANVYAVYYESEDMLFMPDDADEYWTDIMYPSLFTEDEDKPMLLIHRDDESQYGLNVDMYMPSPEYAEGFGSRFTQLLRMMHFALVHSAAPDDACKAAAEGIILSLYEGDITLIVPD